MNNVWAITPKMPNLLWFLICRRLTTFWQLKGYNAFRRDSRSSVRQAAVPVAIATVDVAWPHLRCTQWMTASNSSPWWNVNASPGQMRARMTVVTSPQGRQRIVVHETKVIWFFTNYQFFEHFGLLHKTTKCGGRSLFSCVVKDDKYRVEEPTSNFTNIMYIYKRQWQICYVF